MSTIRYRKTANNITERSGYMQYAKIGRLHIKQKKVLCSKLVILNSLNILNAYLVHITTEANHKYICPNLVFRIKLVTKKLKENIRTKNRSGAIIGWSSTISTNVSLK